MKPPDWTKWASTRNMEGLQVFAQTFEELLFDHTLDTYKTPALNPHFILLEFLRASREVERGDLKEVSLRPIAEELVTLVSECPVMQTILMPDSEWVLQPFRKLDNMRVAREKVRHLVRIANSRYLDTLIALLKQTVPHGKQKERITKLTGCLVCELTNMGFSPKYLYFLCREFFFGKQRIRSVDDLDRFLNLLHREGEEYTVILRASRAFRLTKSFSEMVGIVVCDSPPCPTSDDPKEKRWLDEGTDDSVRHLKITGVGAIDHFSALDRGVEQARLLASFASFHMHRQKLIWENQALVLDSHNKPYLVKPPIRSIHKRPDAPTEERLSHQVTRHVEAIGKDKLSRGSVSVLLRALALHSDAVQSDQLTTQFIYLWTAVETLAVKDSSKARINAFLSFMVPFLSVGYPTKLLWDLSRSLNLHNRKDYQGLLMSASAGDTGVEKLAAIMILPRHEKDAQALLGMCEGSPLLRYRAFRLREALRDPRDVYRLLDNHETRIRQHLQRMYRVRNMILHAGTSMPYLSTLVENLHTYFDRVISVIMKEAGPYPRAEREIEAIWAQVDKSYSKHRRWLASNKDAAMDEGNFKTALFGR